jgi:lipopolysaccharide biosynthesis glycosyltransferase
MFTILNDKHMKLFRAFIKSFTHHNQWFDLDFVILDCGLSEVSKTAIIKLYPNVIFKYPNKKAYKGIPMNKTHEKLRVTYYKLDAFCQYEYDRVISIDMDMIVLSDMKEVFDCEHAIAACQAYNRNRDQLSRTINSGLFVINKRHIDKETYAGLMRVAHRGHSMPDQKTINQYFGAKMKYIDKRFNMEKRIFKSAKYKQLVSEAKVWHYIALKPYEVDKNSPETEKGFEEIERLWFKWYER